MNKVVVIVVLIFFSIISCTNQGILFRGGSDSSSVTLIVTPVTKTGDAKSDTVLFKRDLSAVDHIYVIWDTIIDCRKEINLEVSINDTIISSIRYKRRRNELLRIENISNGSQSGVRYVFLD